MTNSIHVPLFKLSELNTDGYLTPRQALEENILSMIKGYHEVYDMEEDLLLICARRKVEGDYHYGMYAS